MLSTLVAPTTDIDFLHPVAVEGESLIACMMYVPLALMASISAAYAHAWMWGLCCYFSESMCYSANSIQLHPISIGFDASLFKPVRPAAERKKGFVAPPIWDPSRHEGYGAHHEGYADVWFGLTDRWMKGQGWDSTIHLEMLMGGTLPYFIDLERCPKYTLRWLPKNLLLAARALAPVGTEVKLRHALQTLREAVKHKRTPGANPAGNVTVEEHALLAAVLLRSMPATDGSARAARIYEELLERARAHALEQLSTRAIARRMFSFLLQAPSTLGISASRIALGSHPLAALGSKLGDDAISEIGAEMQLAARSGGNITHALVLSDGRYDAQLLTLQHGFVQLGLEVHALPDLPYIFKGVGGGGAARDLALSRTLPASKHVAPPKHTVLSLLARGTYGIVIVGLTDERTNARHGTLLKAAHVPRQRVMCVHSREVAPPAWAMWIPRMCGRAFVRELHATAFEETLLLE